MNTDGGHMDVVVRAGLRAPVFMGSGFAAGRRIRNDKRSMP
jgi:hypothetical protein